MLLRMPLEAQLTQEDAPGRRCGLKQDNHHAGVLSSDASDPPRLEEGSVEEAPLHTLDVTNQNANREVEGELTLLVYDNHFNGSTGPSPRHLLYRSAALLGVPTLIGSLVPSKVRRWLPGDRELWLLRTLPRMSTRLVVLLDGFDTVLQCRTAELVDVWKRLAGDGRILISAEKQLWPEDGTYLGERLIGNSGAYPMPQAQGMHESAALHRYINIGALVGAPSSLLALLQCMRTRYSAFPYQCPIRTLANGSYDYVSTAPFRTKRLGMFKGNWGWEQACFHTYLAEQAHGVLPPQCPHLVLDHASEFTLNINKIGPKLVWPWGDTQRMRSPGTGASACVLHANGAGKYAMPVLHYWWDHVHAPEGRVRPAAMATLAQTDREALVRNFSRDYVDQWVRALKPQLLRESSAHLMLKDALKSAK